MIRRMLLAALLALLVAGVIGAPAAPAQTCRRFVVTILDDPFFAHPICWDLPLVGSDVVPPPPLP